MGRGMFSVVYQLCSVFLICGPILGGLLLLNLRERRERALLGLLASELDPRVVRSSLVIRVRCSLFMPRGRVVLGVYGLSPGEFRAILDRLIRVVPPSFRLAVDDEMGVRNVPIRATGGNAARAVLTVR